MGFGRQLRLLLWKNFTLKKRTPLAVVFEVLIPLVLFLILMGIRLRREPRPRPEEIFPVRALPSAGIIPLLQQFCPNKVTDEHGFPVHVNSSIGAILADVSDIMLSSSLSVFDKTVVQDYKDLKKEVHFLDTKSKVVQNFTLHDIIIDPKKLQDMLANYSIPYSISNELLNTTVNGREIQSLLLPGKPRIPGTLPFKQQYWRHIASDTDLLSVLGLMMGMQQMFNSSLYTTPSIQATQFTNTKEMQSNFTQQTCTVKDFKNAIFLPVMTEPKLPCSLTAAKAKEIRKMIISQIDTTSLLDKLNLTQTDLHNFNKTINHLRRDVRNISSFVELVQKGYRLATLLQLNMSFAEGLQNKSAYEQRSAYIRGMWSNLGPILCGPSPQRQTEKVVRHMFDFHCITRSCQTRALRLMLYLLTHNPKILYAPNNTAADDIIKEANRTFSDIAAFQNIVKDWFNQSTQLRAILVRNDTQHYLQILSDFIKKYPDFFLGTASNVSGFNTAERLRYYQDIHKLLTGKHGAASPVLQELDKIDAVMNAWLIQSQKLHLDIFVGFKDEKSLVDYAFNVTGARPADSKIVAGIIFDNFKANTSLPPHVTYKIRMNATYFTPPTDRIRDNYWRPGPQSWHQSYYDLGFLWLQDQIERAIVNLHSNREVIKPGVYMHEMPYPCYAKDRFMFVIQHMMPLCMTVSWIYTVAIVVRSIVYEKEQRLKEVMKMMGLSNVVHWVAWFITSMSVMSVTVLLLTVILKYGKVLAFSDPLIIWLSLMLFAIVTIVFCFLISAFFSKAKLAAACGGIIYFLTYMPYVFISIREGAGHVTINIPEKMAASLLSTSAFGLGARYFALYEEQGEGVQWHNIGQSPVKGDEFTLLRVLYFLVFDTFLYIVLVWYIEAVHPGSYGLPRPWYFPIQPSYWFGHNTKACSKLGWKNYRPTRTSEDLEEAPRTPGLLAYENEPIHLPLGVTIDHLEKVYKSGIKAVNGLALNLYEGQITSFLGHNGAGKTTTMSILTGLFPPTSGTAFIYGEDIRFDMDTIRHNLGMCPQHNVLFDRLTVDEHLWFYAQMKGLSSKQVKQEMDQLVSDLGLPNKRHSAVETLSGGMKRKLSVAMAFVGGSRTVILDEPTAGVDPYARRAIWDLLIKYKKGRTILLSTHFMEEADILGDRIAIISSGKLRCVGSPLFLKSRFGEGYSLTLVRKKTRSPRESTSDLESIDIRSPDSSTLSIESNTLSPVVSDGQEEKVTNFISSHVPGAQLQNKTQQEFTFILPDSCVKKGSFEKLFSDLEANVEFLGIDSYGITDTSLEEVFLKVTDKTEKENDDSITSQDSLNVAVSSNGDQSMELNTVTNTRNQDSQQLLPEIRTAGNTNHGIVAGGVGTYALTGSALKWQQFYALILKRFHHARRNFKGVISQILLPALFISIAMTMALSLPPLPDLPSLQLSPSMFPRENFIPFGNEAKGTNRLAERLERTLTLLSGVGATCCLQSTNYFQPNNTQLSKDQLARLFDKSCREAIDDMSSVYLKPNSAKFEYIYTNGSTDSSESVTHKDTGRGCKCSANGTWYICQQGAAGTRPKELRTITLDTLQNVTGRNMSKYLLYTTQTFREHRYGGLSFGNIVKFVPKNFNKIPSKPVRRLAVREVVKSWYNNKGYHALPTYLNVMNNAILRASIGKDKGNPSAYGMTAYNHPFPFNSTSSTHLSAEYLRQGTDLVIAIFVIIAMSFVPASFVVFIVMERSSKAKHLQFVSGVNPVVYWFSNYLWDMCNYLIPALASISLLYVFNVPAYASPTNFPAVVCLFMLYGWSITPIMYPFASWFNEASSAYVAMIVLNLFVGITATVSTFILQLFPDDEVLTDINSVLKDICLGFPNYCLGRGLMDLAYNQYMTEYYNQIGENDKIQSPFEWMIVTRNLVFMFIEGIVFFVFTILIEYRFFIKPRRRPVSKVPIQSEDEDVAFERERVTSGDAVNDLVRIENLTKVYRSRKRGKHLAVDRLCLGIPQGECFGLLGVNGAGKTSTFKMLTGDTYMTAGEATLNRYSISTDIHKVYSCIGYCPQFDALIDELTAEEQIYLYARLRGVPEKEVKQVCSWAVKKLGLTSYAKYPCKSYSGGNKRKLSTAIALIGNPPIIFLDEPTTGMDPHARRFLWNLILGIIKDGRSVVLTSHSMEECEALCSRLAIMVNGRFKCLGSCQHLKNRFGEGYIVQIRIQGDLPDMQPVMDYFIANLPQAILKEYHHNMLQYQIPSGVVSLAKLFGLIESSQDALCIEDYSISQTTLDNVFVNFASQQKDESEYDEQVLSGRHQSRDEGRLPSSLWDGNIRFSTLQDDDDDDFGVSFDGNSRLVFNDSLET